MLGSILEFLTSEEGLEGVEYAVILAVIVGALVAALTALMLAINTRYDTTAQSIQSVEQPEE